MSERRIRMLEAAVRVIAQDGVRGLRVEKLAAEAGVSTALIYYHFKDRAGILRAALEHANHRAQTCAGTTSDDPRTRLEQMLLGELQDTGVVRETSVVWGELRASAAFHEELRPTLLATTNAWNADVAALVRQANPGLDALAAAERLTALVEGLSERWHSGSLTPERARELLAGAIGRELG
ncbi:TetR/AcrR family transcriptional regulator [Lentzea aerocolonigenes]|uniref:TetR/AcrR family transcriptional regulator n=1 Tax=Lentzea aerocolonigenes TaxID=68170 RepID=UPI0004C340D3|nr:TetR/AcrR family transcriptional regulator [Lentzea aerocolonigenes]MCP2244474.1 transcriptional regulator, TetR family [Lentzea aerocolonigenes]